MSVNLELVVFSFVVYRVEVAIQLTFLPEERGDGGKKRTNQDMIIVNNRNLPVSLVRVTISFLSTV